MKPTDEEVKKIKLAAVLSGDADRYVYLRKDDKGFYIEYAFKEGAPHDNRCLSWYDSYQEEAYIRNRWFVNETDEYKKIHLDAIKRKRDSRVGGLFKLSSFTCGYEEFLDIRLEETKKLWEEFHPDEPFVKENHICTVGHPAPKCKECHCKHWTYEEPVKCACWSLKEVDVPAKVSIPIDVAMKLYKDVL